MTTKMPLREDRRKSLAWINTRHLGIEGRRIVDAKNSYVDRYEPHLFVAVLFILSCSILDAMLTLQLISKGAIELNLFMAVLIEKDLQQFVSIKMALTCLSIVFLVVHKNFRLYNDFLVRHFIYTITAFYAGLIGYQLLLITVLTG